MSTLTEIEQAATRLSVEDKFRLVRFLVESLPSGAPRPEPRDFTVEQMNAWMDEDEREFKSLVASRKATRQ